jgi:hypothetical protein
MWSCDAPLSETRCMQCGPCGTPDLISDAAITSTLIFEAAAAHASPLLRTCRTNHLLRFCIRVLHPRTIRGSYDSPFALRKLCRVLERSDDANFKTLSYPSKEFDSPDQNTFAFSYASRPLWRSSSHWPTCSATVLHAQQPCTISLLSPVLSFH